LAKSFDDLVKRTTNKRTRQLADERTRELLGEMLLSELRVLAGKSQQQLAKSLGIKQPGLSKLEKQSDMQISTLERIVGALGGKLEVSATFPQGRFRIRPFGQTKPDVKRSNSAKSPRQAVS
jgi:transcriptional regulator with XRE-family HTH domain